MKHIVLILSCVITAHLAMGQNSYEQEPLFPGADFTRQQLTARVKQQLDKIDWQHVERTTGGSSVLYTIPVIIHVVHNYGPELLPDSVYVKLIDTITTYFLKRNADTANIIDKYKPIAASTQIAFKLATIAPDGSPTKGIEHIFSYLTYNNYEQAKVNQWPQERYLNLWVVGNISGGYGCIAYSPAFAAYYPYYDGLMLAYYPYTLPTPSRYERHFAIYLNLPFPCGSSCIDADGIPDTPPCAGGYVSCGAVYDTICDTQNNQNIMINNDVCALMFTYGQGLYMQYILQIDIGNRDSLVTPHNYTVTGMGNPVPDLPPVADFNITNSANQLCRFFCQGQPTVFRNYSWNDTITGVAWTFSNDATTATSIANSVSNKFHEPGWVTVSLAATGNNTGTTMLTNDHALYIADSIPTPATGYVQEFGDSTAMANWPMFNYYSNNFQWQQGNAGYYDNSCLMYAGYDARPFPVNMSGGPEGDFDDVFTPGFDLSGFSGPCFLNFMSSGATLTPKAKFMNDSLEISYSVNDASSFVTLKTLSKDQLLNKGTVAGPYTPSGASDWGAHSISLPPAARKAYTIFRFRYHPGADSTGMSTGNNFYLDHFNFNSNPESLANMVANGQHVALYPNPTQGSALVTIRDNMPGQVATVIVTDVTGKVVYKTTYTANGNYADVEIPEAVLSAKGLYLVHVITGTMSENQKLIVY